METPDQGTSWHRIELRMELDMAAYSVGVLAGDTVRSATDPGIPMVSMGRFGGIPAVAGQRLNASSR
jgi:hypothetical protein